MASITLRAYNREIEGLIDHGQTDEAIAHCMHILQFVPKHIGTYRLLGKAFLESRHYSDAADIFQRVLSSVPDDFVANIGMSIIREDEKNLDGAIWHMERAFEAQPSNAAIQEELRRLYGRRDGLEPPKVRLTRGALSRMYFKGNLFNQAIGELRAALSEDPQRTDLQVLLAQAYYANGQQAEAVDTCNAILKKLPYCLEANRILAAILPETDRALNVKEFLQRLVSLDPYYASTSPKASSSDEVPEKAVVVEKLDYKPGVSAGVASQPAWASSLGVTIQPDKENLPDWLTTEEQAESSSTEPTSEAQPEETAEEAVATPEGQIPEWMIEAGWASSSGPEIPPSPLEVEQDVPQTEGDLVPGEVPDWLREIAPSGALEQETSTTEPSLMGEEVLPWLQESQPGASDTVISWLDKQKVEAAPPVESEAVPEQGIQEEIPEWMSGFGAEAEKPVEEKAAPSEELPDWIKEFQEPEEPASSGVTDWLDNLGAEAPAAGAELFTAGEAEEWMKPTADEQPLSEETAPESFSFETTQPKEEIPDWLKGIEAETEKETPTMIQPEQEITVAPPQAAPEVLPEQMDEEAALAWLESLALKQGAPEEQLTTPRGEQPGEIPQGPVETPAEVEPSAVEPEPVEPALPEWFAEETKPEVALPVEETPDWLKALEGAAPVEAAQPADVSQELKAVPSEEIPDWLKVIESEAPVEEVPTLLTPAAAAPSVSPEEMDQDAALAWLESLALKQGAPEEQLTTQPQEFPEQTAPWVLETPAEAEIQAGEAVVEPEQVEMALPEWLLESTAPETTLEPAQPAEVIPEWLSAIEEEAPAEEAIQESESLLEEPSQVAASEPAEYEAVAAQSVAEIEEEPQEAALAWLESLARKHGVPEEQLVTHPLKPIEEPPAWVQADAEAAVETAETRPTTVFAEAEAEPTQPAQLIEEPTRPTDETVPSWLVSEITQPTVPMVEEEAVPVEIKPVKKLDLNEASLSELEELPGIGFILAQAILDYREVHGLFSSMDDLNQVPGIGPDRIEGVKDLAEVIPSPVHAGYEEKAVEPRDEDEKTLLQGRAALSQGYLPIAIDSFSSLVHKRIYLPEVIDEMKQALIQHPDNLPAWQILGDAYVRNDQLQEALDAYIKAEELLS